MEYNIKDKIEWTVTFVREFGKRHGLTLKQDFNRYTIICLMVCTHLLASFINT